MTKTTRMWWMREMSRFLSSKRLTQMIVMTGDMIGLSSEDEAEEMSEDEYVGRKYHRKELPAPPVPPTNPVPPVPPVPPPQSEVPVTSIQVPIAMLQGVHQALGQLLQG